MNARFTETKEIEGVLRAKEEFRENNDPEIKFYPDGTRIYNIDYEHFINGSGKTPNLIAELKFDLSQGAVTFQIWEGDWEFFLFRRFGDSMDTPDKVTSTDLVTRESHFTFFGESPNYGQMLNDVNEYIIKYFDNL